MIRPPIIVILGHVDHGKTTLLDYIRKTNTAAREAGGITQSIGAYEIKHSSAGSEQIKKITFIDTPGHQAFSKMRARGAKVADLGILVVAADDGVKPQTKEAIEHLQREELPFIVAINKIDKNNADLEKTKNDLAAAGVLLEGRGGNVPFQEISAKNGQGVNELLDLTLLAAEMENLQYNPDNPAAGLVIETKTDSRRGLTVSVILKNGVLKQNQAIATPSACGKIKALENFLNKPVEILEPSAPALILGFESLPQIGEEFRAAENLEVAKFQSPIFPIVKNKQNREVAVQTKKNEETGKIKVILKANDSGSLEALKDIINSFSKEKIEIEIIENGIGNIKENDLKLAMTTGALIIGFKVTKDKTVENMSKNKNITIITSEIVYELLKSLEKRVEEERQLIINGELKVLALFGKPAPKQRIIGGRVIKGIIKNKGDFEIWRQEKFFGYGRLKNLQQNQINAAEVKESQEAGLLTESDIIIKEGDVLKF